MLIAGNYKTYVLDLINTAHDELELNDVVGSEYEVRIQVVKKSDKSPISGVWFLATSPTSTEAANNEDLLLDSNQHQFEFGRGLNRLSFYNGTGVEVLITIAVLF